jgi:CDP-glucose 4,6-dehydratase
VKELVSEILKHWPGEWRDATDPNAVHEAGLLSLAIDKAFHVLQWQPVWTFEQNIKVTTNWYHRVAALHQDVLNETRSNITQYMADAAKAGVRWAH